MQRAGNPRAGKRRAHGGLRPAARRLGGRILSANHQPDAVALRRPSVDIWSSAWTLLVLANLFWAGNIVLGRGVVGMVPPVALAYIRWTGAFLIGLGFAWPYLKRDWPILLRQWPLMLLLSATGIASYNTMSYIGLTETTALNVLLLQSAMPLVILVWAYALFRDRPSLAQTHAGVLVSLAGVAAIAGHGSLDMLLHLSLNPGDVLGADGDGDQRQIHGNVPPPAQGAPNELPGGDDGVGALA